MQDHDERHAMLGRHRAEQAQQGRQAAGRGADADDGEIEIAAGRSFQPVVGCDSGLLASVHRVLKAQIVGTV
jgi:hypothetical protein